MSDPYDIPVCQCVSVCVVCVCARGRVQAWTRRWLQPPLDRLPTLIASSSPEAGCVSLASPPWTAAWTNGNASP